MNKRTKHIIILPFLLAGWLFLNPSGCLLAGNPDARTTIPPHPISNKDYAAMLAADGWPADLLNTAANADYLSQEEKNMVLASNLIRYDPKKFDDLYVQQFISFFRGMDLHMPGMAHILLTREGPAPAVELSQELKDALPLPLLSPSEGLSRAAQSHAAFQGRNGQTGHGGQGGTRARIEREGQWLKRIAENIAYGNPNAHYAILMLMVDDGVPDRGHRKTMLHPDFKVVGVGWNTHPRYDGGIYVIKYASGFKDL